MYVDTKFMSITSRAKEARGGGGKGSVFLVHLARLVTILVSVPHVALCCWVATPLLRSKYPVESSNQKGNEGASKLAQPAEVGDGTIELIQMRIPTIPPESSRPLDRTRRPEGGY